MKSPWQKIVSSLAARAFIIDRYVPIIWPGLGLAFRLGAGWRYGWVQGCRGRGGYATSPMKVSSAMNEGIWGLRLR